MYVVNSALPFVYNPHLRNGTLIIDIVSQHTQCKGSERITRHYFVKSSHSHNYTCFALGQSWPVGKEGHLVDISPSSLLLQVSITSTSTSYLPPIESKSLQKGLFENLKNRRLSDWFILGGFLTLTPCKIRLAHGAVWFIHSEHHALYTHQTAYPLREWFCSPI